MRYLVADLAGLLLFSAVGAAFHGTVPDAQLLLRTFLPLVFPWLAVAAVVGTYRTPGWRSFALTWAVAVPAGILLRQLLVGRLLSQGTLAFLLVGTATCGAVLLLVRLAVGLWERGRRRPDTAS
ncbi:MAG: DUF3054 domain-containing protein [Armatimonadota bacterium]|nr:DUF3054 domain-containing protein [Armatimonadota bacterium]MDW8156933.1 DUF3054 domain-containing protein [Armatimonadota bacterium]